MHCPKISNFLFFPQPLINLAYCILILLSQVVQKAVFGSLRASEQQSTKDQFWNLIFYKIVFIFGVVNVNEVEDAVGWCFFVSIIGFLQFARELSKERHNYVSFQSKLTKSDNFKKYSRNLCVICS